MNDNIIVAKNLVFRYKDEPDGLSGKVTAAVNDVSLDIKRGDFTAIIGHNGSGKSTLAKLLSGILECESGSVKIYPSDEKELDSKNEEYNFDIRKTVGMVFQNPDNQLVATIVEDDVAFAPENLGVEPTLIRSRVDDALKTVGLEAFAKHDTHKLSGGQKQRVAIAGILAMNPECMIFDESTAMLDPKGRQDIINTILNLRARGISVVLITHYMNEAALADKIFVINEGKILTSGTPHEVFAKRDILQKAGLETPQSTSLVHELKNAGIDIDTDVVDVDEAVKAIEKVLDAKKAREGNGNA